ncbi:MAG: hypothetical protein WC796_03980 [Candidatus Pacearchaeota archaeon]|jgi:CheY-like chemotaxis protein
MTEQAEKRILLVEDNTDYSTAAIECLQGRGYQLRHAQDYLQAHEALLARTPSGFNGVITDCFFPEITGSGTKTSGLELVDRMQRSDKTEMRVLETLEKLGAIITLDPELRKIARAYFIHNAGNCEENPTFRAIKKIVIPLETKHQQP